MKFIRNIFIGAGMLSMVAVTSCENGLSSTSPSILTEEQVYSDYNLAEMGVLSVYEMLTVQYSHRDRYLPWYGFNTDIECYSSTSDSDKTRIAQYYTNAGSKEMDNANGNSYNNLVSGIERANLAIRGLETYADLTNPDMRYLRAEAITARAFLYVELLKAYGEVPARFEPINNDNMYINKSDKDVIYKRLISDLEGVFDDLPWPGQSTVTMKTDRVSKAFAKGLYARICLMASGYSNRPDAGQVGTGALGKSRLSDDPELQKSVLYPKALAQLEDIIDNSGLDLYPSYEQLWRDFNNFDLQAGKEVIFVIPFGDGRGRWNYTFAIPTTAGTAGNQSSKALGGSVGVVPSFYYKYAEGDTRRDISCVNYEWEKDASGNDVQVPAGLMNWYFGKFRFEWMETRPMVSDMDDGAKPVYMRYSDILLMAAEIAASPESGAEQNLSDARSWFLDVRGRAFGGDEAAAEAGLDLNSAEGIFDAIVDERAFEFVGEFLRKADLIRWNMLAEKLTEAQNDVKAIEGYNMGPGLWYRYPAGDGVIEMYGNHPGETVASDRMPTGWTTGYTHTNSNGDPSDYLDDDSISDRANTLWHKDLGETIYVAGNPGSQSEVNFNQHQYWPIPQTTINDQRGALKNDYGY